MTDKNGIDLVISFDTTGSMYAALAQLRRSVQNSVKKLFREIPNLRVGVIAHGDYCDAGSTYVTKVLDLTDDEEQICRFVSTVQKTDGGDTPECYELVLHEARSLNWTAKKSKAFVLIGDDVPHGPEYHLNKKRLNWRNEIDCLQEMGVSVYGVQALNRNHATNFYQEIADKTGGFHLNLDQFSYVTDLLLAIAYKQDGTSSLEKFEKELEKSGKLNRNLDTAISKMLGSKSSKKKSRYKDVGLEAVSPGRFQVMHVDRDVPIADFVSENGVRFNIGRGFYELTKRVLVQSHKEVVLQDNSSGDLFSGEKARKMLGLPASNSGSDVKINPVALPGYTTFIQSTSANRKLLKNTKFLYEVSDY